MRTRDVVHEPRGSSPTNAGQLPFGLCTIRRKFVARSQTSPELGTSASRARALASNEACKEDERADHPPFGSCLVASTAQRSSDTQPPAMRWFVRVIAPPCQTPALTLIWERCSASEERTKHSEIAAPSSDTCLLRGRPDRSLPNLRTAANSRRVVSYRSTRRETD